MGFFTYYCGCELLIVSISKYLLYVLVLLVGLKWGLYESMRRYKMLDKLGDKFNPGCWKILYKNDEGDVRCGSYLSGGFMLCNKCKDKRKNE